MRGDTFFREIESNCWDPKVRMEEGTGFGVDVQVLSTVPVMFSYWAEPEDTLDLSRFLNDHMCSVVERYPKRFVGLGTVPMQAPELGTASHASASFAAPVLPSPGAASPANIQKDE